MNKVYTSSLCLALSAGVLPVAAARSEAVASTPTPGLVELSDSELGGMRGRYTLAGQSVAWFGVMLSSRWETATGQQAVGTLQIGFDYRNGDRPQVSFTPTMTIGTELPSSPVVDTGERHIASPAIENVGGLVQSIQLAGDGNAVANQALLTVRDGEVPETATTAVPAGDLTMKRDGMEMMIRATGSRPGIWLTSPQGAVAQWIGGGQVGQSIALTGDGSRVTNLLQMELVRGQTSVSVPLTQNVLQALRSAQGVGIPGP